MGLVLLNQGSVVTYGDVLSFKTKDEVRVKCRLKLRFIADKTYRNEIRRSKKKVMALTKAYLEKLSFGEFVSAKALNRALADNDYLKRVNLLFPHVKIKRVYVVNVRRTARSMPEDRQATAPQRQIPALSPTPQTQSEPSVTQEAQNSQPSRPTPQPAAPTGRTDAWK